MAAKLLDKNISLATKTLASNWKSQFTDEKRAKLETLQVQFDLLSSFIVERRENEITRLIEEQTLNTKKIQNQLKSRKHFILKSRKDRMIKLQEALKVSQSLEIKRPSSLSILAEKATSKTSQIKVNNNINREDEPLYLRGTQLLSAELENIEKLAKDTFSDSRITQLEAELLSLQNNPRLETLKARSNDIAFNEELQNLKEEITRISLIEFPKVSISFQNSPSYFSPAPINKKSTTKILITSAILGVLIGIMISLVRMTLKNYKQKS